MIEFQKSISQLMQKHIYKTSINSILLLLRTEGFITSEKVENCINELGIKRITDIKYDALNVILDYAEQCLEDDILTEMEMLNVKRLKICFKIDEGDFYKCGMQIRVKKILELQLKKMYSDNVIDKNEALKKVDLQELFGLGYDDFLDVVNGVAKESLNRGAKSEDLDTIMPRK